MQLFQRDVVSIQRLADLILKVLDPSIGSESIFLPALQRHFYMGFGQIQPESSTAEHKQR